MGFLMFSWLFLFPAKDIWNRANVTGENNNIGVFLKQAEWLLVRVCGFVPLVVGGSSAILEYGTEISSKQLVMLPWDFSRITFMKYVTTARKQACFPETVCSNSCCSRFHVSFPNQPSNLISCNNSGWFFSQISLSCAWYVFRGYNEGNSQRLQFMSAMRRKASNVNPVFRSTVYHLDVPRLRIVTIQCQDSGILFNGFTTRTKCLNLCVKLCFWIHPACDKLLLNQGGGLCRSSAFMLLRGNTRRGEAYVKVTFMQVTIVTSEPSLLKTERSFACPWGR